MRRLEGRVVVAAGSTADRRPVVMWPSAMGGSGGPGSLRRRDDAPETKKMALDPPDRTTPDRSASDRSMSDRFAITGLTFDDVLLVPAASDVLPNEVSTASPLVPGIT
ncbi:MAG: hypothetical protein WBB52_00025, partial [Acidimicrobiales bacterium]